jgi:rSAM/selenodomain-associated transferase 1
MGIHVNALAVMAKAPVAGQVKTRLRPALTDKQAVELSRSLLVDQLSELGKLDKVDLYLAFTPDDARPLMEGLAPPCFQLFPQRGEDLGARMQAVFATVFAIGHANLLLIGGDLPPVPVSFFEEAYGFLKAADRRVVLGPSRDGGYYLVGCNQPTPQLFEGMSWSHDEVLAQTRARLTSLGIHYHLLPTWMDIDTPDDLRYLRSALSPALERAMPNTLRVLRRLGFL